MDVLDMAREHRWMVERYEELVSGGLNWDPPTLESASEPECTVDGQQMIMLSANNYLNLTTHPKVVAAMIEATQKYGAEAVLYEQYLGRWTFISRRKKRSLNSRV